MPDYNPHTVSSGTSTLSLPRSQLLDQISQAGPFSLEEIREVPSPDLATLVAEFKGEGRHVGTISRLHRLLWLGVVELDAPHVATGEEPVHIPALAAALHKAEAALAESEPTSPPVALSRKANALSKQVNRIFGVDLGTERLYEEMLNAVANPKNEDHDFFGTLLADCQYAKVPQPIVGTLIGLHLIRAAAAHIQQVTEVVSKLPPETSPKVWTRLMTSGEGLPLYVSTVQRTLQAVQHRLGLRDPKTLELLEVLAFFDPRITGKSAEALAVRQAFVNAAATGDWENIRVEVVKAATHRRSWFPEGTAFKFALPSADQVPVAVSNQSTSLADINRAVLDVLAPEFDDKVKVIVQRADNAIRHSNVYFTRSGNEFCIVSVPKGPRAPKQPSVNMLVCQLERRRDGTVYAVNQLLVRSSVLDFYQEVVAGRLLAAGHFTLETSKPLPSEFLQRRGEVSAAVLAHSGKPLPAISTADHTVPDSLAM